MKKLTNEEVKRSYQVFASASDVAKLIEKKCIVISMEVQDLNRIDPENLNLASLQGSVEPMRSQLFSVNLILAQGTSEELLVQLEEAIQKLKDSQD